MSVPCRGHPQCLQDKEGDVRRAALEALRELSDPSNQTVAALVKACLSDADELVREAADSFLRSKGQSEH